MNGLIVGARALEHVPIWWDVWLRAVFDHLDPHLLKAAAVALEVSFGALILLIDDVHHLVGLGPAF
jgi:hypothetical protein